MLPRAPDETPAVAATAGFLRQGLELGIPLALEFDGLPAVDRSGKRVGKRARRVGVEPVAVIGVPVFAAARDLRCNMLAEGSEWVPPMDAVTETSLGGMGRNVRSRIKKRPRRRRSTRGRPRVTRPGETRLPDR